MYKAQYKQYLRSDYWKAKRLEAISFCPTAKCQICLKIKPLDVHHVTYEKLGSERKKDLIPLCRSCHKTMHSYLDRLSLDPNDRITNRHLFKALRKSREERGGVAFTENSP